MTMSDTPPLKMGIKTAKYLTIIYADWTQNTVGKFCNETPPSAWEMVGNIR